MRTKGGGLRWFISKNYRERDKETGRFIKTIKKSRRTPRDRSHTIYLGLEGMNHLEKVIEDLYKQHAN